MQPRFAFVLLLTLAASVVAEPELVKVGDTIPEFTLPYATADTVAFDGIGSKELLGSRYVIASYPADWSGGCTKEMCTFRDRLTDFESLDVEILPLSADLVFSHHEWAKHHKLQFKLLADHTREFGKAMGLYMSDYGMFKRAVFVIGPDGRFEYIDYEYSLADDKDYNALHDFLISVEKKADDN